MSKRYSIRKLKKTKFSLILSGGSSLGLAHIGAIKFLEKNNLEPSEIIGTSMGSIIGALYALGENTKNIQKKIQNTKTQDLFEVKYFQGRVDYDNAKHLLKNLFKDTKIQDTKIPLKIIATKLKNGEERVFTKEDNLKIYDAVLASIAIPGILNVKKINNEAYIDGCVASNLPIEVAQKSNIKIAINVINDKEKNYHYKNPKNSLLKNIKTKFEILNRALDYYRINQTKIKTTKIKKLILIEPNLKRFNSFNLANKKKIIQAGYEETKKQLKTTNNKQQSPLKKIISFPLINARRIIKKLQAQN